MSELSNRIVQKRWSYRNVLRDDGLSYQDYLKQRRDILFLRWPTSGRRSSAKSKPA